MLAWQVLCSNLILYGLVYLVYINRPWYIWRYHINHVAASWKRGSPIPALPLFSKVDDQTRCRGLEAAMKEPDEFDFAFRLAELIDEARNAQTPDGAILAALQEVIDVVR